ncbi:SRPBCC family protein [Opitutus sp. GAS368]|uniref:SRPBCC family protein n=1 Tax=Opitutus sp. GAS368 TaxID=1882749 RepID=UPI0008799D03|nr:SRPBCC family protein [Opitutus sp. GAS368]SDS21891.1 Ligand-binding SRPBCC domain-containing protein [Opitutus sp. GAS368]
MAVIHLETAIDAPRERVFDLARSIDVHQDSMEGTDERAVAGVTSGLIGLGQEVTWEARHLGVTQRLRVKITQFDRPRHFQDVMLRGTFGRMKHDHIFEDRQGKTMMIDRFDFRSPLGWLGSIFDRLFLTAYMHRLLVKRNAVLKQASESDSWKKYLQAQ